MTGLFFASYLLANPATTGPTLQLNLSIDTTNHSIRGHCNLRQQHARFGFDVIGFAVSGSYETIGVPGVASVFNAVKLEADLPDPLSAQPELHLHMLMSIDWKAGNASFRFGQEHVQDATVTLEPTRQLKQAALSQVDQYLRCTYGRAFGAYLPAAFELNFVE
ncbi:MAG: DUF1842 domain-containing protein [Pseudomonadota bacterium]